MMLNTVSFSGKPFHFIGIGGIGMSALAYVLAKRKLPVSGSDLRESDITKRLQDLGAHIFGSQDASNLDFFQTNPVAPSDRAVGMEEGTSSFLAPGRLATNWPQVVFSTAIDSSNSEYRAAMDLGCPIFHRSDLLAALMQDYQSIAVSGTHGKTTTSSLIGYLLLSVGLDPTIVIGGEVDAWSGNARYGQGAYLVAEADESDGTLVKLSPVVGVITNIELDHPDHYSTLNQVVETFQVFSQRCQSLVGSIDCVMVREHIQPKISYSLEVSADADYRVDEVEYGAYGMKARVWERDKILGPLSLRLLGKHNLSNALAAVAVGRLLGLDFSTIAAALSGFVGAKRRFEVYSVGSDISIVDDYAHHPSEIRATLAAARLQVSRRRVVAIFQPHRYSRTQAFLSEFAQSFERADLVVITDIYSAGEPNLGKISGQNLTSEIAKYHQHVHYQPRLTDLPEFLIQILRPGDMALFMGAGNANQVIPEVSRILSAS